MRNKDKKPSDVYLQLGFENLSHFSYAFKKQFGCTPTELRNKEGSAQQTLIALAQPLRRSRFTKLCFKTLRNFKITFEIPKKCQKYPDF